MADEVEISNVGGDNGVASEATLASLTRAIERLAASTGKDPTKEAGKIQKAHNEAVRSGITVSTKNRDAIKKGTEATKKAEQATNKFSRAIAGSGIAAISGLYESFKGFANELLQGGTQLQNFTQHIPLIGGVIAPFVQMLDSSIGTFRDLSSVGASFGNSITDMRMTAANLELSLSEMGQMIGANSESLRLLGGTVTEGIQRFAAINKTMKATGDFAALKEMGFTVEEINEGMADYTALQSRLGRLQQMDNRQLAAGSAAYLEQLDRLSKLTGKSREQMAAQLAEQATDAGIRSLLNQFDPLSEEFQNLQTSLAMIEEVGGPTATAMKDLLDGMVSDEGTAQFLAMLGEAGPAVQDALEAIGDGANPQVLLDAFERSGGELERFANMDADARKQYIDLLRSTNPQMAEFLDASTRMLEMSTADFEAAAAEQARRDEITSTLTQFDDAVRSMRATIASAILESGLFDNLAGAVSMFADLFRDPRIVDSLNGFIDEVVFFIEEVRALGFKEAIKNLFAEDGPLFGAFDRISEIVSPIISSVFSSAFSAIGESIRNWFADTWDTLLIGALAGIGALIAAPFIGAAAVAAAPFLAVFAGVAGTLTAIGAGFAAIAAMFGWESLKDLVSSAWESITGIFNNISDWWSNLSLSDVFSNAWQGLTDWFSGIFDFDIEMPDFKQYLPRWLGGEGRSFFGNNDEEEPEQVAQADPEPNRYDRIRAREERRREQLRARAEASGNVTTVEAPVNEPISPSTSDISSGVMTAGLDVDEIMSYNQSMETQVENLSRLNDVLTQTSEALLARNTETSDATTELLAQLNTNNSASTESLNRLNGVMTQVLAVLTEQAEAAERTERNTRNLQGNNIASGYISTTG